MPDFPNELVEAAAKALAGEWHMVSKDLRARWDSVLPDDNPGVPENWLARAVLATVVPLIQQAERDRLAKQAGEPPPRPHIFSGFAGRWVAVEDAERWAACGVAAERERWEAKQQQPEAVCDRCGAWKGLRAVGESCNTNCGGRVVACRSRAGANHDPRTLGWLDA